MPISQDECMRLALQEWNDTVKKNRELLRWQQFFAEKYAGLAAHPLK
jgi:hypothetical protein